MLKNPELMKTVKFTVITNNRLQQLPPTTQLQSTKILNLSNVPLTKDEIDILKLALSFTPTPKQDIGELENDIFQFTRKLRLVYHQRNSNIVDESIFKLESKYTPKPNENADLENICKELEHTKISLYKAKDNLHTLIKGLDSLIRKIENKDIIIKPADKGSIIVINSPDYYWNICQSHIPDTSYYRMLNDTDP